MSRHRSRALAAASLALAAAAPAGFAPPAGAAGSVATHATIDGRGLAAATPHHPIDLRSDRPATVHVAVANAGDTDVVVRSVRLKGHAADLTLFAYETRVDLRVPAGGTGERDYALDLVDLSKQAVGLLPARLELLDEQRHVISSDGFSTRVGGSLMSVYGLFGICVAAITALVLGSALRRLATHQLPANRWKRGAAFGTAGLGLGLTLTFTLSALAILLPAPRQWTVLPAMFGAALFGVGYLTPSPGHEEYTPAGATIAGPTIAGETLAAPAVSAGTTPGR